MKVKKKTEQAVVKIDGTYSLVKEILHIVEQSTNGVFSGPYPSDKGGYHALCTVFEVIE